MIHTYIRENPSFNSLGWGSLMLAPISMSQTCLYHDAWVYQTSCHRVQYSSTLGGAFEARVYPCTLGYNEASMATVGTDKTNFHKKTFFCKYIKRTDTVQKYTLNTPKT